MIDRKIESTTLYLFVLKLLGLLTSLAVLFISAKYFGVKQERDVWLLVTSFLIAINNAILGPINETFRAQYIMLSGVCEKDYLEKSVRSLFGVIIFVLIVEIILIYLFSSELRIILAPAIQDFELYKKMFYLLIPSLFLTQIVSFLTGFLNVHDIFYIPEIIVLVTGILNCIFIPLSYQYFGIYSLVLSQYASQIFSIFLLLYFVSKTKSNFRPIFFVKWVDVKMYVIFALPFFIPYFVGQFNSVLEKSLANLLGVGMISTIDYARKFILILQTVLTSVLATLMVTDLTKLFSIGEMDLYNLHNKKYFRILMMIILIVIPILGGASLPISKVIFEHGSINRFEIQDISRLMSFFALSFVGVVFYLYFGLLLMSQNKGKFYAILGVCAQLILICINVFLYKVLKEFVFPVSIGVSHLLVAAFMFKKLDLNNKTEIVKQIVFSILIIVFSTLLIHYSISSLFNVLKSSFVVLCVVVIIYFVLLFLLSIIGKKSFLSFLYVNSNMKVCKY